MRCVRRTNDAAEIRTTVPPLSVPGLGSVILAAHFFWFLAHVTPWYFDFGGYLEGGREVGRS